MSVGRLKGGISRREAGSAAERDAALKSAKYVDMHEASYIFQPTVVESLGSINEAGSTFMSKTGRKISVQSAMTGRPDFCFRDSLFLFSVSMLFYYTTVLLRRRRINDHSSLFYLCTFLFPGN